MNSNQMNKKALILEGGGMRGVYTAGVLNSFLLENYNPFDLYIAVSAGACNVSSYLAKQIHRDYRTYSWLMSQQKFISKRRFLLGGHLFDIDWLWDMCKKYDSIDFEKAYSYLQENDKTYYVVLTNFESGTPHYIEPKPENWTQCLKASCTIPYFYKGTTKVNSIAYLDGGLTDPIPARKAYHLGAKEIVVLRTRHREYKKKYGLKNRFGKIVFSKYPKVAELIKNHSELYMSNLDFIRNPPSDLTIHELCPPKELNLKTYTKNKDILEMGYEYGLEEGSRLLRNLTPT